MDDLKPLPVVDDRIFGFHPEDFDQIQQESSVDTTVIKTFERDVRTLLEYLEHEYVTPDVSQAMRRLEKVVGTV